MIEVSDGSTFPTSGHLAAYAGLAPVTRRPAPRSVGEFPARSGNKHLKRAFSSPRSPRLRADPTSRPCYDRKRAEGKKHNAALICLARRRCDVLHTMLKHGTSYDDRSTSSPLDETHRDTPQRQISGHEAAEVSAVHLCEEALGRGFRGSPYGRLD